MNSRFNFVLVIIIAGLFIYQGTFYRWIGYENKPQVMLDELAYVWQGLSIRTIGLPIVWTTYPDTYERGGSKFSRGVIEGFGMKLDDQKVDLSKFRQNGKPILAVEQLDFGEGDKQLSFVAPFFDRPPLGGLVLSLGINNDVLNHSDVKGTDLRKISLALGVIVSILIFIFSILITNSSWVGLFSVAIYNTVPTYILASRFGLGENVGVPFVLAHLVLIAACFKYIKNHNKISIPLMLLSGLLAGAAVLAKESLLGFAGGSLILMFMWKIPRKIIISFIIGLLIPILLYIFWGLWLQGEVFLNIFLSNVQRPFFGSLKFLMTLQGLRFQDFPIDGWWVWGFISLFITCFSFSRNHLPLIVPVLIHLALVLFMGGANYPWYYLSLIPFMSICSAVVIWQTLRSPNFGVLAAFFFTAISSSFYWGYSVFHNPGDGLMYKLLFLAFIALVFIKFYFAKYRFANLLWYIAFIFLFYQVMEWNNYSILYFIEHWGSLPIPSLPKI